MLLLIASAGNTRNADETEPSQEAGSPGNVAGAQFEHGEWEVTTEVLVIDAPDMPGGADMPLPPPTSVRMCMTPEQASRPFADMLTGSGESGGCSFEDISIANGSIRATAYCENDGYSMRSTMRGQYSSRRFELEQQVTMPAGAPLTALSARSTGRRVGDCSRS